MFRKDIDIRFTYAVKKYLDRGFVINVPSMHGVQTDEVSKVDLTNGKEIYRVLLEDFYKTIDEDEIFVNVYCLRLSVLRYTSIPAHSDSRRTVWNSKGEIVSEKTFYRFNNHSRDENYREKTEWFTTSIEEIKASEVKNCARRRARRNLHPFGEFYKYPESAKRNLLPFVRRLPRCKTAHLEDIGDVWRSRKVNGENVINIYVKGRRHEVYLGKEDSA